VRCSTYKVQQRTILGIGLAEHTGVGFEVDASS